MENLRLPSEAQGLTGQTESQLLHQVARNGEIIQVRASLNGVSRVPSTKLDFSPGAPARRIAIASTKPTVHSIDPISIPALK